MKKVIKRIAAFLAAATAVASVTAGISVSAYDNYYVAVNPYKSAGGIIFSAEVTNYHYNGSTSDFYYSGQLYNYSTNSFINSVSDLERYVNYTGSRTLSGAYPSTSLPDRTKCINTIRSYSIYSQYATPYETWSSTTYYTK